MPFDVAIVGGSFAGLSAALTLARTRRRIAIFDSGLRRNRFATTSHGFLAQDGRPPEAILADARDQLAAYPNVQWFEHAVTEITGSLDAFVVQAGSAPQLARRIILATGVKDSLPAIPGLSERWGRTVFHCPYCHGHELQQGRIGVIATSPASLHQAQLLTEWGSVTLFLNGALSLDQDEERMLAVRGVGVNATPISGIADQARIMLADRRGESFSGLFVVSRTSPASPLAAQLGCANEDGLQGPFVRTDEKRATSVPGVFACGDLARAAGNVAMAVGDGAQAATAAHASLVFRH